MSLYIQLMKLKVPLGGTILFAGYPLYKVQYVYRGDDKLAPTKSEAKDMVSCSDTTMRFFIWHGSKDTIFPITQAFDRYKKVFKQLGL